LQRSPIAKADTILVQQKMHGRHVFIEATDVTLICSETTAVVNII